MTHELPYRYQVYGLALHSNLELPELLPLTDATLPVVRIEVGPTPEALTPEQAHRGWQITPEHLLHRVRHIARYLITGTDHITVELLPDADPAEARVFLLGSVLGVLLIRRGSYPLHAGVVAVDGRGVAFTGASGAGKSTLTAQLRDCGFPVLTDDICALNLGSGEALAQPGFPRMKLWRDSLEGVAHTPGELVRDLMRHDKFHVPLGGEFLSHALPLRAIYVLETGEDIRIEPLDAMASLVAVSRNVYRPHLVERMGLRATNLEQCRAILASVKAWRLVRPMDFSRSRDVLAALEAHWQTRRAAFEGQG